MPAWVQRACEHPGIVAVVRVLQQPIVAAVLFSGSFFFWLIPSVHFRAMIDVRLYALMNWTMVLDGLLFWALVLDPRPKPLARISYGTRVALATVVIFPQIALGAFIAFSSHDLYPYYDLCGRLFTSMDALYDQEVGGIIIWIPPAMMSVVGVIVIANALRIHEDSTPEKTENASAIAEMSRGWTGR
jgi:putative membrane protein